MQLPSSAPSCPISRCRGFDLLAREIIGKTIVAGACIGFHAFQPRNPRRPVRHLAVVLPRHPLIGYVLDALLHRKSAGVAPGALGRWDVARKSVIVVKRLP